MVKIIKDLQYMTIRAEEESIAYQGKMLVVIPWLLPFEWKNGKELLYQKGEGQSLTEWLKKERREDEILDVLENFLRNQKEAEAYLIDEEKVILDPEWMFWEAEKKILRLAYVPWDTWYGPRRSFEECFIKLLWCAAIQQKWQNERLILMLYRMQIAAKHQDQPGGWNQWIEQEKRRIKERDMVKERALDILTETKEEPSNRWFQRLKEKIPFAVR